MEEITHVIRVEALAHASRHIEAALERAVPHHVGNVVAEQSQGPEPCEQRAGRAAFDLALHLRLSRGSARLAAGWKVLTRRGGLPHGGSHAGAVREEYFRDPAPIALARPGFGVTQKHLPREPAGQVQLGFRESHFFFFSGRCRLGVRFLLIAGNHSEGSLK